MKPAERTAMAVEQISAAVVSQGHALAALEERDRRREEPRAPVRPVSRLGLGHALPAIPGLAAQFKDAVPGAYWDRKGAGVVLTCSCDAVLELAYGLVRQCECEERFFVYDGVEVRVARYEGYRNDQDDEAAA